MLFLLFSLFPANEEVIGEFTSDIVIPVLIKESIFSSSSSVLHSSFILYLSTVLSSDSIFSNSNFFIPSFSISFFNSSSGIKFFIIETSELDVPDKSEFTFILVSIFTQLCSIKNIIVNAIIFSILPIFIFIFPPIYLFSRFLDTSVIL